MKLLLTADWHIGNYPVHPRRGDDFLAVIDRIVAFAAEYKPDLILHGGDVFRVNQPGGVQQREAAKRVKALSDIAPTVIIPGNHDVTAGGSALDAWRELAPENLHVCTTPEVVHLGSCNVVAIPWLTSRHLAEFGKSKVMEQQQLGSAIEMLLQAILSRLGPKPKILLAHATALDGKMGAHRPVVLGHDLLWPSVWFEEFDLVCLGHLHRPQVLYEKVVYPGSPERVGFGEHGEAKGIYTVNLGEPVFHELKTRPMIQLEGTPGEVTARLKDVPDEALLKIKVHLEPDERFQLAGSRWFSVKVEEIRPERQRETRLEGNKSLTPIELLRFYLTEAREHSDDYAALLIDKARDLMEESNADVSTL